MTNYSMALSKIKKLSEMNFSEAIQVYLTWLQTRRYASKTKEAERIKKGILDQALKVIAKAMWQELKEKEIQLAYAIPRNKETLGLGEIKFFLRQGIFQKEASTPTIAEIFSTSLKQIGGKKFIENIFPFLKEKKAAKLIEETSLRFEMLSEAEKKYKKAELIAGLHKAFLEHFQQKKLQRIYAKKHPGIFFLLPEEMIKEINEKGTSIPKLTPAEREKLMQWLSSAPNHEPEAIKQEINKFMEILQKQRKSQLAAIKPKQKKPKIRALRA